MRYSGGWGLPTIKQGLGRGGGFGKGITAGSQTWEPALPGSLLSGEQSCFHFRDTVGRLLCSSSPLLRFR